MCRFLVFLRLPYVSTPLHHSRGTGDAEFSLAWCMDGPGTCHRGVDKIKETVSPIKAQVGEELNATRPSLARAGRRRVVTVPSFLHGKAAESSPTTWYEVHNPATNELVARVPQSTPEKMRAAVDSAKAAFKAWRDKPISARQRVTLHLARLVWDNTETLAENSTEEQRSAIADAKEDVFRGLEVAENGCGMASLHMENVVRVWPRTWTAAPFASGIAPCNLSAMIPLWMAPVAITGGNTYVMKPSGGHPCLQRRLFQQLRSSTTGPAGGLRRHPSKGADRWVNSQQTSESVGAEKATPRQVWLLTQLAMLLLRRKKPRPRGFPRVRARCTTAELQQRSRGRRRLTPRARSTYCKGGYLLRRRNRAPKTRRWRCGVLTEICLDFTAALVIEAETRRQRPRQRHSNHRRGGVSESGATGKVQAKKAVQNWEREMIRVFARW